MGRLARQASQPQPRAATAGWSPRSLLLDHVPLAALVVAYMGSARWVEARTGVELTPGSILHDLLNGIAVGVFVVLLVTGAFVVVFLLSRAVPAIALSSRPDGETRSTWSDYRRHLHADHLAGLFTVYVLLFLLLSQFLAFKGAIPQFVPFAWDPALMELDRGLHLGRDPWRLLHPLLGWAPVTRALDLVYYLWFPVNTLFFAWMGWTRPSPLRRRFFLCYFLLWVVPGTIAATAFASAGPVYFDRVTGEPGPYGPLLEYLHGVDARFHLMALDIQELLWADYTGALANRIEGISAMPSLHVAVPTLFALVAWKIHRALGWALMAYATLILIGSVHLAWHYAVDGYAAVLVTLVLWWLVSRGYQQLETPGLAKAEDAAHSALGPTPDSSWRTGSNR